MKFVKLGAAYINMDLVTDIWVDQDRVNVFLAVPVMYTATPFQGVTNANTTRELQFVGAEAAALLEWLEQRSDTQDITPPHYDTADQHAKQPAVRRAIEVAVAEADDQESGVRPF